MLHTAARDHGWARYGDTAIQDRIELAMSLLQRRADLHAQDTNGSTAREVGMFSTTFPEIKAFFTKQGSYLGRYRLSPGVEYESPYGSCRVQLATDEQNKEEVALKIMPRTQWAEFKNEVDTLGLLQQHCEEIVGLIRVHIPEPNSPHELGKLVDTESPSEGGEFVLVMPQADRSLGDIMVKESLSLQNVEMLKVLTSQIVEGIRELHQMGVVHGDIKKANIVRKKRNNKLGMIDYDASARLAGKGRAATLLGTKALNSSVNTPPEDAPRLWRNGKVDTFNPAQLLATLTYDMWMLGVTLYELFTGTSLFQRVTDAVDKIHEDAMPLLLNWQGLTGPQFEKILPNCNSDQDRQAARDLLDWLLQRNPEDRPQTMEAVLEHRFLNPKGSLSTGNRDVRGFFLNHHQGAFCAL